MENSLRLAGYEDLESIAELYDQCTEWLDGQGIRQWDKSVYPTYRTAEDAWRDGCLYCIGADPVMATMVLNDVQPVPYTGVSWRYPGKALVIHTLAVRPSCGGMGLGKQMLSYVDRRAVEGGYDCVRIDVFPDNAAACGMYKKNGYAFAGEIIFAWKEPAHQVYHCYEKRVEKE